MQSENKIENLEKNQYTQTLVLQKDQWNWQTFSLIEEKQKPQITKIRNESGDISTDSTEIKGILRQ